MKKTKPRDLGSVGLMFTARFLLLTTVFTALVHAETVDPYRLDESVQPKQYYIHLVPDLEEETFAGDVTILVTVQKVTNTITLHAKDLNLGTVSVSRVGESSEDIYEGKELLEDYELVVLNLAQNLEPEVNYQIKVTYDGKLQNDMYGFYISTYTNGKGEERKLATTQFQPTHARKAFPCFDEPGYKARFQITIVNPAGYHSLSNMPSLAVQGNEVTFENSVFMSTYLVAFVVSEYSHEGTIENGVDYKTWVRDNALERVTYSLEVTPKLLEALEKYTDYPYTSSDGEAHLSKVDQVAIPDFSAGAMENWGLITYRESILLFDDGSQDNRKQTAMVIAHEIAHMWFGNLVTTKWWAATWLNEGFANYFQFFATSLAEPEFRMMEQYVVDHVQMVMETDAVASTLPLTHPISTSAEASARFFQVSYSKGGSLLRMLNSMIGETKFQETLQNYLKKYAYQSVNPEHLFSEIERHAGQANLSPEQMREFLISWTEHSGFPVVTVKRDFENRKATVTQKRFLYRGEEDTLYYVPLTWTQQGRLFDIWKPKKYLTPTEPTRILENMPGPEMWLIFNVQQTGYYRVNYDERNWQLIIDYLKNYNHPLDNIHVLNRAQLLDDAFNLARAGQLPYATAFDLAAYLPREHDYVPWAAALSAFSYLDRMFASHEKYPLFQRYIRRLLSRQYARFDFGDRNPEELKYDEKQLLNRINTRACAVGHGSCNARAADALAAFIENGAYIHPDLRSVVYCYGIKNNARYWNNLWDIYDKSLDDSERARLVTGLGCAAVPGHLKTFLGYAVDGKHVRKQDAASVFSSVYSTPYGAEVVLEFLSEEENFDKTREYIGIASVVSGLANRFTTQEQKDKLEAFVTKYSEELGNTALTVLTTVQNNIDWISENADSVFSVIERRELLGYRLPGTVVPRAYTLTLSPDLTENIFDGEAVIYVDVRQPTDTITLHASGLDITSISVRIHSYTPTFHEFYDYHTEDADLDFLHIHLKQDIPDGDYVVKVQYSGILRDDMYGFYRSTYRRGTERRTLAATQFQPTHARKAFPCFDEPQYKAEFAIRIFNPPEKSSISNMPLKHILVWDNQRTKYVYVNSVYMSSYLVAFVVSDFTFVEDKKDDEVLLRTWARPEALKWADYSMQISRVLLNALEEYTNIKYTDAHANLDKLDQVAIPDFSAGAMENWGLITYRETALLYNDGPAAARKRVATVIAHELVHMWFGNLVTTKSWDSTWLNEGFAQYFQFYATSHAEPEWRILDQFVVDVQQTVYRSDMLASAEPLTARAYTPAQISARFGTITYSKGASFVRMLNSVLGADIFRNTLRDYLREYTTEPKDLFKHLMTQADTIGLTSQQMETLLRSWTEKPGFPLISVTRNYGAGTATITQKRFLSDEISDDSTLYYVPLTWAKQGETFEDRKPQAFLPDDVSSVVVADLPGSESWVIFNVQETGYYRVNYDERNWALIAKHLAQGGDAIGAIHVLNRAQLVDDAFNLARGGHLPYATALDLADYLQHEADFIPWTAAATTFNFLDVMLAGHEKYPLFQRYILHLLDHQYERFKFEDRDTHDEKLHLNRITNLACTHGHEHCRTSAKNYLIEYLENNEIVPADLRSVVYCNGIRESAEHWDRLWGKYTESLDDAERALIATGLGCSTDAGNLKKLLAYALDEAYVRKQDASSVFSAVYASPFGGEVTLDFLSERENFEKTRTSISITSVLSGIATRFTTREQQEKMKTFLVSYSYQLGTAATAILSTVQSNLDWISKYAGAVVSSLEERFLEDYRLPNSSVPRQYTISIFPDMAANTFEGEVRILVETNEDTDTITLHASGLVIKSISVVHEMNELVSLYDSYTIDEEKDFLHIHLKEVVSQAGYYVTIQYAGTLRNDMYGFYRSTYKLGDETRSLAATQFQPTHARKTFPCFDEPRYKTQFTIRVFNPPGLRALSNMPTKHILVWDDKRTESIFYTSMHMATYLVAFVVSDFTFVEDKQEGEVLLRAWARPEALEWAEYSREISRPLLNALEDYTNIKYTDAQFNLDKLDQVAIPDFSAGAMENWGLITYRETALLYNDGPAAARKRVANTIAHELVHMWFGNLVTTKSWDSTWLNEGFAQYFQFYATSHAEPEWRILDQFVVDVQQTVYRSDMLASAEPLTARAYTPAQISARFGTITYSKGASFVRMLNSIFGETEFRTALRKYIQENSEDKSVEPKDLFKHLTEERRAGTTGLTPKQMEKLLLSWTEQPGFPLVTVTRDYSAGTATVKQKRFLAIDDQSDATLYYVPLTWAKQGDTFEDRRPQAFIPDDAFSVLISDLPDADSWVIFNVQETGYYRVNYDERNWALIAKHLAQGGDAIGAIHVLNRAQLIDDAFNLARGGHLPYATALDLADYLQHEADFIPWTAAATAFNFLDVMLAGHDDYSVFQEYILRLLDNQYERFKFEDRETHEEKLHLNRITSLACTHGHNHCREHAEITLSKFLDDGKKVPADLRSVVYCHGVRDSKEHWDKLWLKYTESHDDAEKALIATGLGCSTDSATLKKYLQYSIEGSHVRRQDASSIFTAVYTTTFGVEVALEYLEENLQDILNYYGSIGSINSIMSGIAARLTTQQQKEKLEAFVTKHKELPGWSGDAAVRTVQENLNWVQNYSDIIIHIIQQKNNRLSTGQVAGIFQKPVESMMKFPTY